MNNLINNFYIAWKINLLCVNVHLKCENLHVRMIKWF